MLKSLKQKMKIPDWSSDPEVQKELKAYEKYIEENKEKIWKRIMLNSVCTLKLQQPVINCCKKINLTTFPNYNAETIGHILGKHGQHKQIFVNLTGVDLEIDKKAENTIVISKYNAAAVAKACELIKKLMQIGKWNIERMTSLYDEVLKEWKESCIKKGSEILKNFLQYEDFTEQLANYAGELEHIYSFNQNILEHCVEVAQISADIAGQMGLDSLKAKRAGFFHDIGKAVANYDDHVDKGLIIAKEANLDSYILNTIESHHGRIPANNPYAMIVKSADRISAGREGARPRQIELIESRKKMIEDNIMMVSWVEKVFVHNAGNLIQIFIKISKFKGDQIDAMKTEIKAILRKINSEYSYNFQIEFKLLYEDIFFLDDQ